MSRFSVVIPVYKNEASIVSLLDALGDVNGKLGNELECVFVVDGSPDGSYEALAHGLPARSFSSQLIRLSRNFGSFAAIRMGLSAATGPFFAVMSADLQEPPALLIEFFQAIEKEDVSVVLGVRGNRRDPAVDALSARTFWWVYRSFVQHDAPAGGVDVFACDRRVRDVLLSLREANSTLIGLLLWTGFKRKLVSYDRQARVHGKSAWTLRKKLRYMVDSFYAFSDIPILLVLAVGAFGIVVSLGVSVVVFIAWLNDLIPVRGYTPLMLIVLFSTSLILTALGLIGGYVWRAFENTKQRPLYIPMSHETFSKEPKA